MADQTLKLRDVLTFDTVPGAHQEMVKRLQDSQLNALNIDLQDVRSCDSAGLALLIEAKRLGKQFKKTLTIENLPQVVSSLAEFCGVREILC